MGITNSSRHHKKTKNIHALHSVEIAEIYSHDFFPKIP